MPHMCIYTCTHTYIYIYIYTHIRSLPAICKVYMNYACVPLKGANLVFSMLKNGAFSGNRNDPSAGILCSPHRCRVPCGIAAGTLCVLTARARCPDAVCLHGLAHMCHHAHVWPPRSHQLLQCIFSVSAWFKSSMRGVVSRETAI